MLYSSYRGWVVSRRIPIDGVDNNFPDIKRTRNTFDSMDFGNAIMHCSILNQSELEVPICLIFPLANTIYSYPQRGYINWLEYCRRRNSRLINNLF